MITFIGLSSSEQTLRGYWRVTLKGNVLDLGFLFSNPLEKWPDKVERWRASVDAGKADIPAVTSPASVSSGSGISGARAVVDVKVLGADQGDTVGAVARRLDGLTSNVAVESVQLVNNADPVARDAALKDSLQNNDPLGIHKLAGALELAAKLAIAVIVIYAVVKLSQELRK